MLGNKNNTPSTKEEFIRQLEQMIISGKLAVDERLPTEREFEKQTAIGKSAIHCALIDLKHKGFINIVPRKGAYVANYSRDGSADTLNEVLRSNGGKLSSKISVEAVELLNAIEGVALIRLAEHHTDEDMEKLKSALDELRSVDVNTTEVPDVAKIESDFHMLICELSGNDIFMLVLNSLSEINAAIWKNFALFWGFDALIKHDEELIGMIERGEGHEARIYIESIFAHFLETFLKKGNRYFSV